MIQYNVDFDTLVLLIDALGFIKTKLILETLPLPGGYTFELKIKTPNKYLLIPYEIRISPDKDRALEVWLYYDDKLMVRDTSVKRDIWLRQNLKETYKILRFARQYVRGVFKNKTSDTLYVTVFFVWGEIREDIKDKLFDIYLNSLLKLIKDEEKPSLTPIVKYLYDLNIKMDILIDKIEELINKLEEIRTTTRPVIGFDP